MDNTIEGRILLEGTDRGIADLVVVLYDIDPVSYNEFATSLTGDDPIEHLYTSPQARTWIDFPGDRIGSVITDTRGRFTLTYDDEAFRVRNDEKRPDLVLFVLGPDRRLGSGVVQRLLHYAFVARANAGRIESFVVSIAPDLLRSRGVYVSERRLDPEAYLERERSAINVRSTIRAATANLIREQLASSRVRRDSLRSFRAGLSRKLLEPGTPTTSNFVEARASLAPAQRAAIDRGIAELSGAGARSGIRFRLTPELLGRLGIDIDRLGRGDAVDVSTCDLLALKGLGAELTRVRRLLDQSAARRRSEAAAQTPDSDSDGGASGSGPDVSGDPGAFIQSRVLGQLAELPELQRERSPSTIEELQKIKETINRLELSGGPANVTAFHDFHTLQVAWQDVWTAAFDERLRDQVLDLYRETVTIHEEYGLEIPPMDAISDANELRNYLAELRDEVSELAILPVPPDIQEAFPQLDLTTWNRLSEDGRNVLRTAAMNHLRPWSTGNDIDPPVDYWSSQEYLDQEYEKVMKYHQTAPLARAERLMLDVAERMSEPYAFKYFAPGSINYGVLVTYRQEWVPETYQVGRLVATLPLAPGEERKLKISRKVNKSRAEKAIEKALFESTSERQFTSRTELEVMSKVSSSTNFRMSATGSFNIGIGQITSTSEFAHNQQQEASRQKKQFMEATQKAAEHVRQETEVTVETNESAEEGIESDTVIKNPNNELTVTYLMYELERRYRISSRPHKLTPVILVALDIPAPHEITEGWIQEHAWILKRLLLDDQFLDAIEYVEQGLLGDSFDTEIKKANWETQGDTLRQLESDFERLIELRNERQNTIVSLLESENLAEAAEPDGGQRAAMAIFSGGLTELFGRGSSDRDELIKARREAAEKALEYLKGRVEALSERVSLARKAFAEAAEEYAQAMRDKTRKDSAINQLKMHLRQNILHYMQGIWDYRDFYLELNDREVPFLESASRRCRLRHARADEIEAGVPGVARDGEWYVVECEPPRAPDPADPLPMRRLGSIADLNRPLGYKGNYIIYPLKGCSYLTDYMSQDFVDEYFGLRDPSTNLGYTGEELLAYAAETLHDPESGLSDAERDALIAAVRNELVNPSGASETVILPTGQLYMEALKGEQTLLEDFKLAHRGLDVLKVQEEVRSIRLENLRRGRRLIGDTPDLEDPEIDKTVWVREGRSVSIDIDE